MTEAGLDRPQPQQRRGKDGNGKASRQDRNKEERMESGAEETPPHSVFGEDDTSARPGRPR